MVRTMYRMCAWSYGKRKIWRPRSWQRVGTGVGDVFLLLYSPSPSPSPPPPSLSLSHLFGPSPTDLAARIEGQVALWQVHSGPGIVVGVVSGIVAGVGRDVVPLDQHPPAVQSRWEPVPVPHGQTGRTAHTGFHDVAGGKVGPTWMGGIYGKSTGYVLDQSQRMTIEAVLGRDRVRSLQRTRPVLDVTGMMRR